MAKKPKLDPLEDAHFRLDDHERKFDELGKIGGSIPSLVDGAISMLSAQLEHRLSEHTAEMVKLTRQDVESDREVAESNKAMVVSNQEMIESNKALIEANRSVVESNRKVVSKLERLIELLMTPTTRTATLNLPSGQTTMTVRESRA